MKNTEITKEARQQVYERDSYDGCPCCIYCGSPYALHVHHVKRRSQGGEGNVNNLVCLCVHCHTKLHNGDSNIQEYCERYLKKW